MLDAATIWDAIVAGAFISSSEAVKLATKQAYTAVKDEVIQIWGRQASRAIDKVEADPKSTDAKSALQAAIPTVNIEDEKNLTTTLEKFNSSITEDSAARLEMSRAQVRFKLDIDETATVGEIENAASVDIEAKAKNFESKKISMLDPRSPGKS